MAFPSVLPKSVLSSPSTSETTQSGLAGGSSPPSTTAFFENRSKFEEAVCYNKGNLLRLNSHKQRMDQLRKELDYIQSTEWMYQPINKYIGQ